MIWCTYETAGLENQSEVYSDQKLTSQPTAPYLTHYSTKTAMHIFPSVMAASEDTDPRVVEVLLQNIPPRDQLAVEYAKCASTCQGKKNCNGPHIIHLSEGIEGTKSFGKIFFQVGLHHVKEQCDSDMQISVLPAAVAIQPSTNYFHDCSSAKPCVRI